MDLEVRQKHAGGRPSKDSPERRELFLNALREGASRTGAASAAGMSWRALREWIYNDPDLAEAATIAEGEGELLHTRALIRASLGDELTPPDSKATVEILKRRYRSSGWGDTLDVRKLDIGQVMQLLRGEAEANEQITAGPPILLDGTDDL